MAQHIYGFLILSAFFLLGVSSRPSNELTTPVVEDTTLTSKPAEVFHEHKSMYISDNDTSQPDEYTKDILDKINSINASLKKPNRRQQLNFNTAPTYTGSYTLNKDLLQKLQQIIASGKLQPLIDSENYQEHNNINIDDENAQRYSKSLPYATAPVIGNQIGGSLIPLPHLNTIPVIFMPSMKQMYNPGQEQNTYSGNTIAPYQTRASPFQFQWPLGQYFPVLIKDPLLGFLQGGQFNNFFEYGQNADVCSRKQRSSDENAEDTPVNRVLIDNDNAFNSREGRGLKKRNISQTLADDINTLKKVKKFFSKPATQKPIKQQILVTEEPPQDTKSSDEDDGDLRLGAFTWYGNKKPIAPSPGFFINKLKVQRGGVAIAGPGGVATAGRGGAAIVGPGGLAYTQPGGLAVAGPAARVIALPSETNLASIISKLQELSASDSSEEDNEEASKEIMEGTKSTDLVADLTITNTTVPDLKKED